MSENQNRQPLLPAERHVVVALLAAGVLMAISGFLVYAETTGETTGRKVAESIIQLAFVALIGGGLAYLIRQSQASNDRMRQEEAEATLRQQSDREKRLDFMRRLRAIHVRVEYARALTRAHKSQKTWFEQSRELMKLRPELAEVEEDIRATDSLFSPDQDTIIEGLAEMNRYLEGLEREYVDNKSAADLHARQGTSLDDSIDRLGLKRLQDFIGLESAEELKLQTSKDYLRALTDAKGAMRGHVFGSREDTLNG